MEKLPSATTKLCLNGKAGVRLQNWSLVGCNSRRGGVGQLADSKTKLGMW